jgi:hypothetical protein
MPAPIEQELTSDSVLGPSGHGTRVPRPGAASLAPKTSRSGSRLFFQIQLVEIIVGKIVFNQTPSGKLAEGMVDGSNQLQSNRLVADIQLSVANAAGTTSAAVTTITFVSSALPLNYAVFVAPAKPTSSHPCLPRLRTASIL